MNRVMFIRAIGWASTAVSAVLAVYMLYHLTSALIAGDPMWRIGVSLMLLAGSVLIGLASYSIARLGPPAPGWYLLPGMALVFGSELVAKLFR